LGLVPRLAEGSGRDRSEVALPPELGCLGEHLLAELDHRVSGVLDGSVSWRTLDRRRLRSTAPLLRTLAATAPSAAFIPTVDSVGVFVGAIDVEQIAEDEPAHIRERRGDGLVRRPRA